VKSICHRQSSSSSSSSSSTAANTTYHIHSQSMQSTEVRRILTAVQPYQKQWKMNCQVAVLCDREGNRRSAITAAMRHKLLHFHLLA